MNHQQIINQAILSLQDKGFSVELIALYIRQMDQFSQLYTGHVAPINSFSQSKPYPNGVAPLLVNPASLLTPQQQWAIACGADVAYGNGYYLNDLSTSLTRQECR